MDLCPKCSLPLIELSRPIWRGQKGCALHGPFEVKGGSGSGNFGHAGRHGEVGGSAATGGDEAAAWKRNISPRGSGTPIKVTNVDDAIRLLEAGHRIELQQPRQVSTVLSKLAAIAADAKAKGEKAPKYNLCNISVPGTNLFCADNKGILREDMPQLKGVPQPGSQADKLPKNAKGEVDLTAGFLGHLDDLGVITTKGTEQAAYLRATQSELDGAKVSGMMEFMLKGNKLPGSDEGMLISSDNYVVDGHHRWAAQVGVDASDGVLGNDYKMNVLRVDMPILPLIGLSNSYAAKMGIGQMAFGKFFRFS